MNFLQTKKKLLWTGNEYFHGLNDFFKYLEQESYKIQYRVMLSRYRGKIICPDCSGTRLRKEAYYVQVAGKNIGEIVSLQAKEALAFFQKIKLNDYERKVAERILLEIKNRLQYLNDVGLGYLTLNRLSNTLSGGESQRINLATALGSSLVGSLYVLDEPSIGLHPRDTQRLIKILRSLRDAGNTVLVVEHDEEIIRSADEIIDMGPRAGTLGGEIVFHGSIGSVKPFSDSNGTRETESLTLNYLTRKEEIPVPVKKRKIRNYIKVRGARANNLKNLNVQFPLNVLTVVTGVSGSGKTSLVKESLYKALKKKLDGFVDHSGNPDTLGGNLHKISAVEMVDQEPIGKSTRSNPATYMKIYDDIRHLFAEQPLSRMRGYRPSMFSFNVEGGRCEECEGEGEVTIEMQFMADVHLTCEMCNGKRFKEEILEIQLMRKNIAEVLNITVDEAIDFFSSSEQNRFTKSIVTKLKHLQEVGMGYIQLGQSSATLSGGEAQRVKLASFLADTTQNSFFIFDEPTTGLHFHDIKKLLYALNRLVEEGNSIVIIEHNPEIIKCADWVIDLGPEGGEEGGYVVFEGPPEELINCPKSHTGKFLKEKFL